MLFLLIPKSKIINSRKLIFQQMIYHFSDFSLLCESRVNFVLHIVTLHASLHFHHITKIEFPPPPLIPPFSFGK